MSDQPWLIDTSALVRIPDASDVDKWNNRIERRLVHARKGTRGARAVRILWPCWCTPLSPMVEPSQLVAR